MYMLDIQYIRDNRDEVVENCSRRRVRVDIDQLLALDAQRRDLQQKVDDLRAAKNRQSSKKPSAGEKKHLKQLASDIRAHEKEQKRLDGVFLPLLMSVPNKTHTDVPDGGEQDFKLIDTRGEKPNFSFEPKDHDELLTEKGLLDFAAGAAVAGSDFYFARGELAELSLALIRYGLDLATKRGYTFIETPDMAREEIIAGAGFQPRGEEGQFYTIEGDDLALIGSAEIPTLGMHANQILDLSNGPMKYVALSHCFRRESGSYGRTSKGLYRVHQFTKLELFIFCAPDHSEQMHQELLDLEKEIYDGLELHYRIIDCATADLGASAYRKFDLEAWMTMKGESGGFGEVTSASNCLDYQARRLGIRCTDGRRKIFAHTLNGTAITSTRLPIAIVEQHQTAKGRIRIPKALVPYMNGRKHIE
jgi:seryl-tRNA synthetase